MLAVQCVTMSDVCGPVETIATPVLAAKNCLSSDPCDSTFNHALVITELSLASLVNYATLGGDSTGGTSLRCVMHSGRE